MRLLIISLDAAYEADAETLLSLPNLGALADRGVFCRNVQTIYPSLTYPIHTSIITGCYPDKHGIPHNEKYAPDTPAAKRAWYWEAGDIRVPTLHQEAMRAGREVASILWPVSGRNKAIRYNFPEVHALAGENQTAKVLRYGSFWWLLKNELKYGKQRISTKQPHLDSFATLIAQKLIEKQYNPETTALIESGSRRRSRFMPDLLSIHLVDLDAARHQYGTHSKEAMEALHRLDQNVGILLKALNDAGVMDDTIIAVVSDHGQADVEREFALDAWLKANGVPARAQTLGLGAYIHCGRGDYHRVMEILQENRAQLHIKTIYTRQQLRAMHAPQGIVLAVEPEDGIEYVDDFKEEQHRANHGFGPEHPAAQCLLWLSGPPFLQGARLRGIRIVDIAPTLAYAMRLELPQAQGRVLYEAFVETEKE
jgi:hypothetical protein